MQLYRNVFKCLKWSLGKRKILPCATKLIKVEDIVLSEINQYQKEKYYMTLS